LPGSAPSKTLVGESEASQVTPQAKHRLQAMENEVAEGLRHGLELERRISSARAETMIQEQKFRRLEGEEGRLQNSHDGVTLRLKAIMEPKLAAMAHRLTKRQQAEGKTEVELQQLDKLKAKYRAAALATIAERKRSLTNFEALEEEIRQAERRVRLAKSDYERARRKVSEDVAVYKTAQTRYVADQAKQSQQKEAVAAAAASIDKTHLIYKVEGRRIDIALNHSFVRLHRRMDLAKLKVEKSRQKLKLAAEALKAWREQQREMRSEVSHMVHDKDQEEAHLDDLRRQSQRQREDARGAKAVPPNRRLPEDWAWSGDSEGDDAFAWDEGA